MKNHIDMLIVSQRTIGSFGYLVPRTSQISPDCAQAKFHFAGNCIRNFLLRDSSNEKERSRNGG